MTPRDPRSRAPGGPLSGRASAREPTQSLSLAPADELELDEDRSSHPSLAVGTSEASREERTKIESPGGRHKTPPPRSSGPPPIPQRNSDDPEIRLDSVLGSYRLVELLGKGGMGYVYRAEHVKLGREVALKVLRTDYARRRDAVLRFFQEAKTVNRVRHRNIVDVTDFVELDDGSTFIIMELLSGQSLGKWARTGVDLPRALAVLVQICDGLGAAHAVGVIHRDLKPDNVIVVPTSDGAELVKLLDFGVAKLLNRDDEDIGFQTAAGSVIGTPAYMSPEQAGGMVVDHRSDIYSLGAIMYELFCGQPMFRGRSFGEYVRKHLTEMPVMPRETEGGAMLDERLAALIMRCLAKDPNERFNHILELRDSLLHLLGGVETVPPAPMRMPMQTMPPHVLPLAAPPLTLLPIPLSPFSQPTAVLHAPARTLWWVWFAGGACAVGLGVIAAVWYADRSTGDTAPELVPPPAVAIVEPAAQDVPTPGRQMVELRFDSLPSGGVYADGRSAELCRTPCSFNVDLRDGGPADHRTFVVRADGYRDKPVEVDLTAPQHDLHITLERLALPSLASPANSDDKPERPSRHGGHVAKSHAGRSTEKTAKPVDTKPEPADDIKPVDTKPEPEPTPPPEPKRPDDKIDPTDTHDPFRHP